jgi:hypothetical protein
MTYESSSIISQHECPSSGRHGNLRGKEDSENNKYGWVDGIQNDKIQNAMRKKSPNPPL